MKLTKFFQLNKQRSSVTQIATFKFVRLENTITMQKFNKKMTKNDTLMV